jgi:hypothetical protein
MIFQTIIHNTNAIAEYADLDQCADETTYAHEGYGKPDTDLVKKIIGKPGVSRSAQIVISCDVHRFRPRSCVHRHNKHKKLLRSRDPMKQSFSWTVLTH